MLFEFSLIPLVILVIIKGYQKERLRASVLLLFFTILRSIPFFLFLINLNKLNTHNWLNIKLTITCNLSFFLFFIFFVKLPIYRVHIWLPKAHVESHVLGSIILAAIILKIGGFGLYRFIKISDYLEKNIFFLCW